jgi:hypothetical protein
VDGIRNLKGLVVVLCGGMPHCRVAKRAQSMRGNAPGLGALTVCKVFLLELAFLDGGLRVLSLGALEWRLCSSHGCILGSVAHKIT